MERLDRMFAEAAARAAPASTRPASGVGEEDGEDAKRERTVAAEILEACASGDPFTALSLPKPECDDAGRPVWDVTEGQISKAFRKRSLAVHPDKNPSAEAKAAFDKLNEWHRALKDPVKRGEALRKHADDTFRERCRLQPELVARMKRDQERRDVSDYGAEILRQQRERAERAAAIRDKARLFRKRHREDEEEDLLSSSSSSSDDDDEPAPAPAKAADEETAKRPKFGGGASRGGRGGRGGRGARSAAVGSDSDSDSAGLARPLAGGRGGRGGGRKPRFIM
jgi:curved DNA-binding protein CbpA